MLRMLFTFLLFITIWLSGTAQDKSAPLATDSVDLLNLSLDELLNLQVKIEVASNKGDNIFTSPSTVSVITKEDIEKYNYSSLSEALQTVSGFFIERTYIKRNIPTSRGVLQDHYANKVLVLIEGVPSWNAVTGEGNLDRINILDIERIEVLKGPASVIYGTNAYSGAVNLILKKEKHTQIHGGIGQYNSYQIGGNTQFTKKKLNTFIAINSSNTYGPDVPFTDEEKITKPLQDYITSNNASLNLKYGVHSLLGNLFSSEESFYGVTPKFSAGAGNAHLVKGALLNYTFNHKFTDKLNTKLGTTFDYGNRNISRLANDSIRSSIIGNRVVGNIDISYQLNNNFSAEIGGDFEQRTSKEYRTYTVDNNETVSENGMKDVKISELSAFGQLIAVFSKYHITLGGRYNHNELYGYNISPRATVTYSINPKNSLKLIFGKSYRTPSLFENYFLSPTTIFGNTGLMPETAESLELAYLTSFKKIFLQATVYHSNYKNKIYRSKDETINLLIGGTINDYPSAYVYSNGESFGAHGIEIDLKYANPRILTGFVNIDYIIGNDDDAISTNITRTDENNITTSFSKMVYNYLFVPEISLSTGIQRDVIKNGSISFVYNFISTRGAILPDISAQHLLDVNMAYKQFIGKKTITHRLSCKNILDSEEPIPEYNRLGEVNAIPFGDRRFISYSIILSL